MLLVTAALLLAPGVVSAYDPRICYIGRFDRRNAVGPIGSWPAVEAKVRVRGPGLKVTIQESGHDWIQIVIDGSPTTAVELQPGVQTVEVMAKSPGDHTYEIVKRTEPFVGNLQFLEFSPKRHGSLLRASRRFRRFEAIGDSITCGFGNEGSKASDPFTPATENAYQSYASIAARKCDADVDIIAWSGRKMYPDNTIPSIYDLTVPTDPTSTYNFKAPPPEAILINLGTNDFGRAIPDEAEWTGAYKGFVARLRNRYPKAIIYVAIGSMMNDDFPEGLRALTTIRSFLTRMVDTMRAGGDSRIRLLEFDTQLADDGFGAAYHPNLTTHQKMADRLEEALHRDLHW
jgi:hypothetical protein